MIASVLRRSRAKNGIKVKMMKLKLKMDGRYGIRCEKLSASEFDDVIEVFFISFHAISSIFNLSFITLTFIPFLQGVRSYGGSL